MRAVIKVGAGIGLILIGIVGLILPIMPGWVFIVPGLILIGEYFPPAQRLVDWGKAKLAQHDPGFFKKKPKPEPSASPDHEDPDTSRTAGD